MAISATNWLFVSITLLYAASSGCFMGFLARGHAILGRVAKATLALVLALQLVFLLADASVEVVRPPDRVQLTLTLVSMLVAIGYLFATVRYRVTVLGAFVAPICLLLFLGTGIRHTGASATAQVGSVLLPVHIALSVLGIVAFALATATAVGYILQENLLRAKRLGGIFERLPALDTLDRLSFRMSLVGFPLLSAGIVIGSFWILQRPSAFWQLTASQSFALLAWVVFGAVIALRVAAGWSGRRAAVGTLIGFALSLAVLFGYALGNAQGAAA